MNVYFISGLGADERVFTKLALPETWTIEHIKWPPLSHDENLYSYCRKIAALINTSKEFAIVGVSFGGIVAIELAKILEPKLTIIISSISTKKESPFTNPLFKTLPFHQLVPSFLLNKVYPFTSWFFGVNSKADKMLLDQTIKDTDPGFMKWAINEIVNWENEVRPEKLFHIHGTEDRIFPFNKVHADYAIEGGGHFMVYINADIISRLLIEQLS